MKVIGAAHTDRGVVRRENQDSYAFSDMLGLYVVADGMGGRAAGQRASEEATRAMFEAIQASHGEGTSGAARLRLAIESANAHLWELAQADRTLLGMGTTVASVLIEDAALHIAHVGDSRVIRVRNGTLSLLTRDHSYLGELIERGLEPDPETRRRYANVLTRAVGTAPTVEVDVTSESLVVGDTLLICSDGVHRSIEPAELGGLVAAGGEDLEGICRAVIDRANAAGGHDNSTIIVLRAVLDGSGGRDDGSAAA